VLGPVTANQVAYQLFLNGKITRNKAIIQRPKCGEKDKESEQGILKENFSVPEFQITIDKLKNRKAVGLDHIYSKQIKNFG